jgi:hypothetical protein
MSAKRLTMPNRTMRNTAAFLVKSFSYLRMVAEAYRMEKIGAI